MKISLDRSAIRRLGYRAEQNNKILLVEFVNVQDGRSCICYCTITGFFIENSIQLRTLAGDGIQPFENEEKNYDFLLDFGKIFGWEIYWASKKDLLVHLDRPIAQNMITKILAGTLQVL